MTPVETEEKEKTEAPVDQKKDANPAPPAAPPKKRPQQTFLDECAG